MIYIVEDDINILEIETFALKNSGYEVEGFDNARDFYKKVEQVKPALVILDIMLPDEDGMTIVHKLRKQKEWTNIPILMVTAKATEIDTVKALDAGADDYLTKPFGVMELISRVKALLRRTQKSEDSSMILGDILLEPAKRRCKVQDEVIDLTFKEYELLKILMEHSGEVVKREILMEEVWGTSFEGESRTLDMHVKTLRKKLKTSSEHIKTVRNVGYKVE